MTASRWIDPLTPRLEPLLRQDGRPLVLGNAWGSSYALILAAVIQITRRPVLLITATLLESEEAFEDLQTFGAQPTLFSENESDALATAFRLRDPATTPQLLVASAPSLALPLPSPQTMKRDTVLLRTGEAVRRESFVEKLVAHGFENVSMVESPGQFGVRGSLLDVFPFTTTLPVRIDFLNNTIESIRTFDPDSQGSLETAPRAELCLVKTDADAADATLLDYLTTSWLVALKDSAEVASHAAPEIIKRVQQSQTISLNPLPEADNFKILSLQRFSGTLASIPGELRALSELVRSVAIFCKTRGEQDRLREILTEAHVPLDRFEFVPGVLNRGFVFEELQTAFVPHHELFNRYRVRRGVTTGPKRGPTDRQAWQDLERGDIVVHQDHGLGRFTGIERVTKDGVAQEFLVIEYDGGAKLYTPMTNIDLIQKYLGAAETAPPLHRLGGKAWDNSKVRAWESVLEVAQDMVKVQALREMKMGIAYPADTNWEHEFETSFPYEETEDQITAIHAIKHDMASPRPMDRLLCGDVGYGKTELAMRAAFKAATHGKQTAVLVPTTLLAQQHYQTFRERMADYPIAIEVLSRFKTRGEQQKILDQLAAGKVDVVIGTHRLLQSDVVFKDLGLVVIDEEQRFGVDHKERLKRLRATVDILTLTATPIPRTLHMSLLGIKDISSLATPPRDRLSIRTEIIPFNEDRIRSAIRAELGRAGQVFFVHNRVMDIDKVAEAVRSIVPEASVGVAHGQMNEDELEETMLLYLEKEIEVLVATTIIESGLDIPNANTILINNADQFGLADLHQLRGRVGRYKHQAHCYLIVPRDRPIMPQAQKRLKAIEEFSELGSGFKIAMRDLEIRGVGNLLGREQHGHITAIGYEMYCKMLERAAKQMKNEKAEDLPSVTIDLPVDACLPEEYLPDLKARLELYRKLSQCRTPANLDDVRREMIDRFGPLPPVATALLELHHVRILAARWKIVNVALGETALVARYLSPADARKLQKRAPDRVRIVDDDTLHFMSGEGSEGVIKFLKSLLVP